MDNSAVSLHFNAVAGSGMLRAVQIGHSDESGGDHRSLNGHELLDFVDTSVHR